MSHSQPTFSPAGTPLADRTVGELVAERPNLSRVFQAHKMDFCCQGRLTLRGACERKGVDLDQIVGELEEAMAEPGESGDNPALLPVPELVDYIIERHHGYLRRELPRLYAMSERVAHVHGGHTPSLVEILHVFTQFAQELADHTKKEEAELFPAIVQLVTAEASPATIGGPISRMLAEHDEAGESLARLRELTNDYVPPPSACNTYRALFSGLADLEADMHRHIHLENSVLFPSALKLQAS